MMVPLTYPSVKHGEERLRVNASARPLAIGRGHTAIGHLETYGEAFFVLSGEEIGPMEPDSVSV